MDRIPKDLVKLILKNLLPIEAYTVRAVCKPWKELIEKDYPWHKAVLLRWYENVIYKMSDEHGALYDCPGHDVQWTTYGNNAKFVSNYDQKGNQGNCSVVVLVNETVHIKVNTLLRDRRDTFEKECLNWNRYDVKDFFKIFDYSKKSMFRIYYELYHDRYCPSSWEEYRQSKIGCFACVERAWHNSPECKMGTLKRRYARLGEFGTKIEGEVQRDVFCKKLKAAKGEQLREFEQSLGLPEIEKEKCPVVFQ